jgi:hypothetical protein
MDEACKMMGPKHLFGRIGRPEEIARAAVSSHAMPPPS